MKATQIIRAAIPDADLEFVDFFMWSRTPFPFGRISPKQLYKYASGFERARNKGVTLCELCTGIADDGWCCKRCRQAMRDST